MRYIIDIENDGYEWGPITLKLIDVDAEGKEYEIARLLGHSESALLERATKLMAIDIRKRNP